MPEELFESDPRHLVETDNEIGITKANDRGLVNVVNNQILENSGIGFQDSKWIR